MQPKPNVSAEMQQKYQIMTTQYKQLMKTIVALEDQKKEHLLVLKQIESLEDKRRCYRTIGGILVERNVGETRVALRKQVDEELNPQIDQLRLKLKEVEREILDIESEIGYKRDIKQEENIEKPNLTPGLLASSDNQV